jgi:hypothetical protein
MRPAVEHDPEKWIPVFGKDHAQIKKEVDYPTRPAPILEIR